MGLPGDESLPPDGDPRSALAWRDAVRREERRGELLSAFDLAERGVAEHPDDLSLKHRAVLALARTGATDEAASRFAAYGLDQIENEEIAALGARIAKDFAFREEGEERRRQAAKAAERYAAVFARTGGYYPAVNAASLWLIAGDRARSRELARAVLGLLASAEDSYYSAATEAEAQLLLGNEAAARAALESAAARHDDDWGAVATTRRQLQAVCDALAIDPGLLAPLAGPGVAYFCGHRIAAEDELGRFPHATEACTAASIAQVVKERSIGFAYGSLAGGADILWAEELLTHRSELHVVLPFSLGEFVQTSVAPCGPGWVERFERLLAAASDVRYATDDAFLGDDVLFRYGSELAMGLALLRARYLNAQAWQLALWDGAPAAGAAGTAIDVATWQDTGRPAVIVAPDGTVTTHPDGFRQTRTQNDSSRPDECRDVSAGIARRVVRAMLFGDINKFSTLTDEQLPTFATRVLGALAEVVQAHQKHIWHRNTWGDAIYLVVTDAATAASCALDLQQAMAAIDLESEGLPTYLGLRLAGHLGPVFPTYDPLVETNGFMGSHVSRTARIEPVTPPGAVYVTEPFAAALALTGHRELTCDYVGHMAAAKGYGRLRMYRLRRARHANNPASQAPGQLTDDS